MQLRRLGVIFAVVLGAALLSGPSLVFAQAEPVEATPKGAIGFGLIGAELGVAIPAVIGMDATWAYLVFPAVGAAGGALFGHFVIDNNDSVEVAVVAMTAGMALVIPTLVLAMAATAYDPDEDLSSQAKLGPGVLRLDETGGLHLGTPNIGVVPSSEAGKPRVSGVQMAMFSGRF